jgi:hypothetical protein
MRVAYALVFIAGGFALGAIFGVWRSNSVYELPLPIGADYNGSINTSSWLVNPVPVGSRDLHAQSYEVNGLLITPVEVTYSDGAVLRSYRYKRVEKE